MSGSKALLIGVACAVVAACCSDLATAGQLIFYEKNNCKGKWKMVADAPTTFFLKEERCAHKERLDPFSNAGQCQEGHCNRAC